MNLHLDLDPVNFVQLPCQLQSRILCHSWRNRSWSLGQSSWWVKSTFCLSIIWEPLSSLALHWEYGCPFLGIFRLLKKIPSYPQIKDGQGCISSNLTILVCLNACNHEIFVFQPVLPMRGATYIPMFNVPLKYPSKSIKKHFFWLNSTKTPFQHHFLVENQCFP